MEQNKIRTYLLYAVGEIALVMIGILLALQVNNWNESRNEQKLANEYLKGIEADMRLDIAQIDSILVNLAMTVSIIQEIDPIVHENSVDYLGQYSNLFVEVDTSKTDLLFYRGISFRSNRSSYNSLVSDGKTGLIKDRELFQSIQEIYENDQIRINSVYESIKEREEHFVITYPLQKKFWGYKKIKESVNEPFFLHLSNFTEMKYIYGTNLTDLRRKMTHVIQTIGGEI